MNFLGKNVYIIDDFFKFSKFKKNEIEFYITQLGAIISNCNEADIILIDTYTENNKIKFSKNSDVLIMDIIAFEKNLFENEEYILKKIVRNFPDNLYLLKSLQIGRASCRERVYVLV